MIFVALGANLPSLHGTPAQSLKAAVKAIDAAGIRVVAASHIWKTAPVPFDPDIPWYLNGAVSVDTNLSARALLKALLTIEADFGRVRTVRNAPRVLDLDLIAYHDQIIADGPDIIVPHPRMESRAFVLMPMAELAPDWVHPQGGILLADLIQTLPTDQRAENTGEALL